MLMVEKIDGSYLYLLMSYYLLYIYFYHNKPRPSALMLPDWPILINLFYFSICCQKHHKSPTSVHTVSSSFRVFEALL